MTADYSGVRVWDNGVVSVWPPALYQSGEGLLFPPTQEEDAVRYAAVMAIWATPEYQGLTNGEKLTLTTMAYGVSDEGLYYGGQGRLATLTGLDLRYLKRVFANLIQQGLLEEVMTNPRTGRKTWRILIPGVSQDTWPGVSQDTQITGAITGLGLAP